MKLVLTLLCTMAAAMTQLQAQPIDIAADHLDRDSDGNIKAIGGVEVIRGDETLKADELYYRPKEHILEAKGNVVLQTPQAEIRAVSGEIDTRDYLGALHMAEVLLPDGGRFSASHISRQDSLVFEAEQARFSACPPDRNSWELFAASAVLDKAEGTLTARGAKLNVAGLPVFYAPYWQQVLRRRSGFLTPSFASSNRLGTELSIPFYWAPRPNWDMTLAPRWMSARGLRPELEARHINPMGRESVYGEWLYDSQLQKSRGHLIGDMDRHGPFGIRFTVEADHVSDRDYLADFATSLGNASGRYVQSTGKLAWQGTRGTVALWARHQQDLIAVSNAETAHIVPRFESTSFLPTGLFGAVLHLDQQTTRFTRRVGVDGWRIDLYPHVDFTRLLAGGGIATHLRLGSHHTRYWLRDAAASSSAAKRTSAEASLETKVVFARIDSTHRLRHSIESTVRYDFVEVGGQSMLPNFDSAFGGLTMGNLLSGNRFSGRDRIENSNRLALLVTNRIDTRGSGPDGRRTVLLARVGATYNVQRHATDGMATKPRAFSNLLGELEANPTPWMNLAGQAEYNPFDRFWPIVQTGVEIQSRRGDTLSVSYRATDGRFVSVEEHAAFVGATILLTRRWAISGTWHFDINNRTSQEGRAGIAYNHPCWNLEIQGYRFNRPVGTGEATNIGVRFLLGLKGLGSVSS